MPLIRRRPAPKELTAERIVEIVAGLMGTTPMGRAQKTKGRRYDLPLPGNERGEVKLSNGHTYQYGGFRHTVSNLFGHGKDENDGEYFIVVVRRRNPCHELSWPDSHFGFLFFSRSQLTGICSRSGMLNLPANLEPGGGRPKDRSDTVKKNAVIWRAVVYAQNLANAELLVAANPNDPTATARPKVRNTRSRFERREGALIEQINDLAAQLEETRTPRFLQFLLEHVESIYTPVHVLNRRVAASPTLGGVRGLVEQRLSRRHAHRAQV